MADFEKPLPPWFSLSETNPGPNALVSAIVFISIAEVASLTKVVTAVLRSGRPRADDYFIIASMVSAVAYTTFVCLAMVQDPEDDSDGHSGTTFYRWLYASNLSVYPTLALAKGATAIFTSMIFTDRWQLAARFLLAAVAVWFVLAESITAVQCLPHPLESALAEGQVCIDRSVASVFIKTSDILTDIGIALLPGMAVRKVNTSARQRWLVALAFALRLITVPFTIASLDTMLELYRAEPARKFEKAVSSSVWTSLSICVSLTTSCVPSLRKLLANGAAGVIHPNPEELQELELSSHRYLQQARSSERGPNKGGSSRNGSRFKSSLGASMTHRWKTEPGIPREPPINDDDESQRHLTGGIWQSQEYSVESENDNGSLCSGTAAR